MKAIFYALLLVCVPAMLAEDLSHKIEAVAFGSVVKIKDDRGHTHSNYGGQIGFGFHPKATVFAEVSHTSIGGGADILDLNGGVKYSLLNRAHFEPYVLGAVGATHADYRSFGPISNTGASLHAGGGARLYVRNWWGVQPEVRYIHTSYYQARDSNLVRFTGGIFFQFGR